MGEDVHYPHNQPVCVWGPVPSREAVPMIFCLKSNAGFYNLMSVIKASRNLSIRLCRLQSNRAPRKNDGM